MISCDFETYYDNDYSLKKMGAWTYCFHEKFDCYQVAIVGPNGVIFTGHPRDFDWNTLRGELLLAHNASFDRAFWHAEAGRAGCEDVAHTPFACTVRLSRRLFPRAPNHRLGTLAAWH